LAPAQNARPAPGQHETAHFAPAIVDRIERVTEAASMSVETAFMTS